MSVSTLELPSGRHLDYLVSGSTAADAFPLVYIGGTPFDYGVAPSLVLKCAERNFKLISFSRAGYGYSTRHPGRTLVDVVDDVRALVESLGYSKCFVAGWSGAGPYVLACAAKLPSCKGAVCAGGTAPYNAPDLYWMEGRTAEFVQEFEAAISGEAALREYIDPTRNCFLRQSSANLLQIIMGPLPEIDKKAVAETEGFGIHLADLFRDSLVLSSDGWVDDILAGTSDWGFDLSKDIKAPVFLYHGSLDTTIPFAQAQWLASKIDKKFLTAHLIEGEGHMSIWACYYDKWLDELSSIRASLQ